ncbi:MAG: GyrI-like domain-containing protein [Tepidisphaeraceae bacterium]|jgi:hypothetical protein
MKFVALQIALAAIIFPTVVLGQTPGSENLSVGSVRELNLKGFNYLYVERQVTRATIADVGKTEIPKLFQAIGVAHIQTRGPVIFIFPDHPADPNASFNVEMGVGVVGNVVAPNGYELTQLPEADCQTVLYGGPMTMVGRAFEGLMPEGSDGGATPTSEIRIYMLYYEDVESPNDVALVALVMK